MSKKRRQVGSNPSDEMFSIIQRIAANHDFESMEDLQKFINENVIGKTPEDLQQEFPMNKTPRMEAQDLVFEAYRSGRVQAKKLIRKALELDSNCAEAFVFKGETSGNPRVAMRWYSKAIEVAEITLGKDFFIKNKGHFWGIHETRPYMKAKSNLAYCLKDTGERTNAIRHFKEILELNPSDNQGVRYELFTLLLLENNLEEATKLYEKFQDDFSANWYYNSAILFFKKEGKSKLAKELLKGAIKMNPHVPAYFFKKRKLPLHRPDHYGMGDENEAYFYLESARELLEEEDVKSWFLEVWK